MKLKRNEKILLYATVAIISVFVFQKFFLSGIYTKMKAIRRDIMAEELKLKTGLVIQKRKDTISNDYKNYKDYLKKENLSEADTVANFLKEVESMAQASSVSIINLTPRNQAAESLGYKQYSADLRVEGTGDKIIIFLNKIQTSKLLIKIDKISVTPKDEQASLLRLDTTISMAVP